jgi:hypothetical protein
MAAVAASVFPASEAIPVDGQTTVPSRQCARVLDGIHTEAVVQLYADRALVLVTQLGRVGCLVSLFFPLLCFTAEE